MTPRLTAASAAILAAVREDRLTAGMQREYRLACVEAERGDAPPREPFDCATFFDAKAAWSRETFGPANRYDGVVAHIRKELDEILAQPDDLEEWVDVVLLAMDGAWRSAGAHGERFVAALTAKDAKNRARTWPDWRTLAPDTISEHVKPAHPVGPERPGWDAAASAKASVAAALDTDAPDPNDDPRSHVP